MKKISILYMLLSLLMLSSCAITRTFNVHGKPNSEACLQTNDTTYNVTLDATGLGQIKWLVNKSPMPAYFVSGSSTSLTIPAAIDYKITNDQDYGTSEFIVGNVLFYTSAGLVAVSPAVAPFTFGAAMYGLIDGYKRGFGADSDLRVRYLPFHTNDDIKFSMVPSRPSGEPKQKRTPGTKQTKRQAKTSSKKSSSKQESKATDDAFYHTVEQGEKLADIAKNYGVTMAEIIRANKLKSNNIKVGQKLIIPM